MPTAQKSMPALRFKAQLFKIGTTTILKLPEEANAKVPSHGQVAVRGSINGHRFQTVLEPDGHWGHWIKITPDLQKTANIAAGDTAELELGPAERWPEPDLTPAFAKALEAAPQKVKDKWKDITPMARWEWLRWINDTKNPDTRTLRIEKSISKLNGKHRRPCCFNLAGCTDPDVSKGGFLAEPTEA